ncbi:uroporphyrinogen-III C-methyltransferase [Megasphaera hexanoica]|uniref:uroporphyrinogen-III C-methyltransferase n=1 Tax=Megasphaera hexanoica TaxID=1675036 RepID=A0A848BWH8_9FIRM|nr:uroporphyrinogen-III C-methyltransferase [Megasphaera hexanoica]NME27626.1 uroporphyrinogen-III C-methyltransferase [Megasphaera hexanoica]
MTGTVYLVGAGPGDWRLLTLRGKELLERADTVVTDHLADERLLDFARPEAERIYVGKTAGHHTLRQEEINDLLIAKAREGRTVVRLKGGDPFVFGRGGEEGAALFHAGIPFEVVPGISSAIAVPAYAGIPVTERGMASSFSVITGHEDPKKNGSAIDWEKLATGTDTLVFVMGVRNLPDITARLISCGRSADTPAAIIRWGTRSDQTTIVTTLGSAAYEAARQGITPPAIFLVGDVVRCRGRLRWFDKRPLFGLTVGITRTRRQASALSARLEELGASCIEIPTIRLEDPSDHYATLDQAIYHLTSYDWLLFTSSNGVHRFFHRLREFKEDSRALGGLRLGVIGSATAEALRSYGLQADVVPPEYRAESLADSLLPHISPSSRVLLVRAEQARNVLPDRLHSAGARVTIAPAYRTVPASENRERLVSLLEEHALDLITCTSSSTVTSLLDLLGDRRDLLEPVPLACIGPVTAATCTREGLTPALTASTYTIEGLTQNILDWRRHHNEI